MKSHDTTPIAIVGMGCRFPDAPDLDAFARLLLEERSAIRELPARRFDAARYYDPDPGAYGKSYCRIGACVDEVTLDGAALGLTEDELAAADVLHLWALDVAHRTLRHAGLDPRDLRGENVGVVLGHARGSARGSDLAFSTAIESLLRDIDTVPSLECLPASQRQRIRDAVAAAVHRTYPEPATSGPALFRSSDTAGVIARTLGFTGRHLVVDAACASSFAALDVAVRALRQRHVRFALAGGASYTSSSSMVLFAQARALSADGSFPFDARANGFVSAEGVGLVLLERLDDALAAGRTVHGVIHGIGGSSDGRGKGLWAPNKKGQVIALQNAYRACGIDPAEVGYVEAHGTSTALGDATEVESLTEFFGPHREPGQILIGSVKSNIGHCREAAGIASLMKVLIAFRHQTIPASINYREPNPHIDWTKSPLRLASTSLPWPRTDRPRIAAIDSFGIGGLNYHVIVEEPPSPERAARLVMAGTGGAARVGAASARPPQRREPIALVGIGCLWPGARGAEAFWARLRDGHTAIGPVPAPRLPADIYLHTGHGSHWRTYTDRAGVIDDFAADWRRYRMPPRLVDHVDPLQLMVLESALDALADAGLDPAALDRRRVSTLVGSIFGSDRSCEIDLAVRAPEAADFVSAALAQEGLSGTAAATAREELLAAWRSRLPEINEDTSGSATASPLASRIAMTLDLQGSSFAVDAGPSASLASLEIACEALAAGDTDIALWAGADRGLSIPRFLDAARQQVLSSSGRAAPFDRDADGLVLSEGAAVGVLMRLEDARARGHRVYAVIQGVGSATRSAGSSPADSAAAALATAMRRAHEAAGVAPQHVAYIEAVGAGTRAADDGLLQAARTVLCEGSRETPVLVGSVAANIGHAQGAAGSAAVVKTALALHHGTLPPTPGIHHANPHLTEQLEACVSTRPFPAAGDSACAAVSVCDTRSPSYHVILEGPPAPVASAAEPIVIRAASRPALERELLHLAAGGGQLGSGGTYGSGSVAAGLRAGPDVRGRLEAAAKALASPTPTVALTGAGVYVTDFTLPDQTCFMFSGQGSQYPGMLREVARAYPAAAARLRDIDEALVRCGEEPLSEIIWHRTEHINDVLWTQMAVLGGDLMMAEVARAHGLEPHLITGHSYGDYPALVAAGAWTLDQVVQMTVLRCKSILVADLPGSMAAVFASRAEVARLLVDIPGYAVESNINAPDEVIVSGEPAAVDVLLARCQAAGVTAKKLPVPRAFHCELMRPAVAVVEHAIREIAFATPSVPFMTSAGAKVISTPDDLRLALVEQFTRPVDFIAQIDAAYARGCRRFVEIGPGRVLARLATRILGGRPSVVVSLDDKKASGLDAIESALAALRAHDVPADRTERPALVSTAAHVPMPGAIDVLPVAGRLKPGAIKFFDVTTDRRSVAAPPVMPAQPVSAVPTTTAAPPAGTAARTDRSEVEQRVIDLVCESSGYPHDLVSLDSDLEADLGIDTVKQAQIFGRIREHYDLPADEHLAIREVPSPRLIADYVERALAQHHPQTVHEAAGPAATTTANESPVEEKTPAAAGPVAMRHIIRVVERALPADGRSEYRPERLVVLGSGPVADALSTAFAARGTEVSIVELDDLDARGRDLFTAGPVPDVCVLAGLARDGAHRHVAGQVATLVENRDRLLEVPLRALQAWMRRVEQDGGTARHSLFAVTALGGALGHANAADGLPEGGGILGLFKNLRHEFPHLRVKVLDTERGERPDTVVHALMRELDSGDPRVEVGLLRGKRLVPRVIPSPARVDEDRLAALRALPSVVLTGGGRGITAEIAVQLAAAGVERLHLIGRTALPPEVARWRALDASGLEQLRQDLLAQLRRSSGGNGHDPVAPAAWDRVWTPVEHALEIDRNLQRMSAAGAHVTYHACDSADALALAAVLDEVRAADGPIRAIIHGAGVQHSRGFLSKTSAEVRATLAPKLDGTVNLLELTAADPLELFVSFGSVAGRFGGLGQADYSMACDLLARITATLGVRRPSCRAVTIAWPGWDEVGMAARTRHLFDARGRSATTLMPVEAGCRFLIDEIAARDAESEVVIGAALESIDSDRQVVSGDEARLLQQRLPDAATLPLVDDVLAVAAGAVTVECRLDADRDPFLLQHRHARTAIMPAVVSLQLLADAARLARPDAELVALEHVEIDAGIKLAETRRLSLLCTATAEGDHADLEVRGHHIGRHARLLAMDRTFVTGGARYACSPRERTNGHHRAASGGPRIPFVAAHDPGALAPADWYHGPIFRTLVAADIGVGTSHGGRLQALTPVDLRPWRPDARWWVPAPLLDGCLAACALIVRTKLQSDGLPVAFGRVRVVRMPRPGESCDLEVHERGHDDRRVHFDFTVTGEDGSLIVAVDDYALRTFHRIGDAGHEAVATRHERRADPGALWTSS